MSALVAALAVLAVAAWVRPRMTRPRAASIRPRHMRRVPHTTTQQWAALLDAIAAEVRTGSTVTAAVALATSAATWCRHNARPDADEAVVLHVIAAARSLGGPVAPTLDAAAALLRERIVIRAEAAVHSAQARLSARVLTLVPLVFCGWSILTSASFRRAWGSPIGLTCAAAGGACNLVGWWWMRHTVSAVQR